MRKKELNNKLQRKEPKSNEGEIVQIIIKENKNVLNMINKYELKFELMQISK